MGEYACLYFYLHHFMRCTISCPYIIMGIKLEIHLFYTYSASLINLKRCIIRKLILYFIGRSLNRIDEKYVALGRESCSSSREPGGDSSM